MTVTWVSDLLLYDAVVCEESDLAVSNLVGQVINEDQEKDWAKYSPLGYSGCNWRATGLLALDKNFLGPSGEETLNPGTCLVTDPIEVKLYSKATVGYLVKGFGKVHDDDVRLDLALARSY